MGAYGRSGLVGSIAMEELEISCMSADLDVAMTDSDSKDWNLERLL